MSGLRMIMPTLDAQVGPRKQIEAERFRKFWRCRHQPATLHNKSWGLFMSQLSSLFLAIRETLLIDTFLDQLISVIDTSYQSRIYQRLVDIVQATILRYTITHENLQVVLAEIVRVGKAYERFRLLPSRTSTRGPRNSSRTRNKTPFPAHRDNPIALTTIPVPLHQCTGHSQWLDPEAEPPGKTVSTEYHMADSPLISVCWRCCATPDDVKRGLVITHNSSEKCWNVAR